MILPTASLLQSLGVRLRPDLWAAALAPACQDHDITTRLRLASFLAETLHEAQLYAILVENLNYSAEGLIQTWPYRFPFALAQSLGRTPAHPANQRAIAERVYGGRMGNGQEGSGDGYLYRGRGLLQHTGKAQYVTLAALLRLPLAALPALLETPPGAARAAAAWWDSRGCNAVADRADVGSVRQIIDGGGIGLADVQIIYAAALRLIPAGGPLSGRPAPVVPRPVQATPQPDPADTLNGAEFTNLNGA